MRVAWVVGVIWWDGWQFRAEAPEYNRESPEYILQAPECILEALQYMNKEAAEYIPYMPEYILEAPQYIVELEYVWGAPEYIVEALEHVPQEPECIASTARNSTSTKIFPQDVPYLPEALE